MSAGDKTLVGYEIRRTLVAMYTEEVRDEPPGRRDLEIEHVLAESVKPVAFADLERTIRKVVQA